MDTADKETIREVIKEEHQKFLEHLDLRFGFDVNNPKEMQRDMMHLRRHRLAVEAIERKTWMTVVGILIAGAVGALFVGLKETIVGGG